MLVLTPDLNNLFFAICCNMEIDPSESIKIFCLLHLAQDPLWKIFSIESESKIAMSLTASEYYFQGYVRPSPPHCSKQAIWCCCIVQWNCRLWLFWEQTLNLNWIITKYILLSSLVISSISSSHQVCLNHLYDNIALSIKYTFPWNATWI